MIAADRPLLILHLTTGSDAGGLSRYLLDLCAATAARGHQALLAGQRGAWHRYFEEAGWPWFDLPLKGGPLSFFKSVRLLQRELAGRPIDLIHAHDRRAALLGRRLQYEGRPPLLYTLHLSHLPMGMLHRWFSDFGDHVHAPSEDGKRWIVDAAGYPAEQVTVIPHGIDPERFPLADEATKRLARTSFGIADGAVVAAYVGRLDHPKNVAWLVTLAQATRSTLPRLRILIAGDGPDEPGLRTMATRLGVADRVTFLGHRDPLPVYQAADLLLLPSEREGFSLACAEAMSVGVPVLRTRTSGTSELIVDGVTGVATPITSPEFTHAAIELLSNPTKLRTLGRSAAAHVRTHLTFNRQVEKTMALYRRLGEANVRSKA